MVRRDLTNREIEQMHREEPGSAARYLEERREEIAAEEEKKREEEDKERYIEEFMAAGGTSKVEAGRAYEAHRNMQAAQGARARDEAAARATRQRIAARL